MTTDPRIAELERQLAEQRDKNAAAWKRINELEAQVSVRCADRKSLAERDARIRELEVSLASMREANEAATARHVALHASLARYRTDAEVSSLVNLAVTAPAPDHDDCDNEDCQRCHHVAPLAEGTADKTVHRCSDCATPVPTSWERCLQCFQHKLDDDARHR